MYNIHSHYENILAYVNTIVAESTLVYLHPFGATHPNNVESMQNLGFGPLIIAYDQEPLMSHYNDSLFKFINNNYKNGLGFPKSTILLNTERIGTEKNKIINKFNYIDVNYFFHGLAATDWYRGYQFNADITPVSARKIKKKYITFNRITGNSRVYRSFLR